MGLLSGIFGVGGGFLMTPLLIMFGIPPTVAAASDSNQIVGASTSGTLAHFRLGNVDFKMGMLLLIGGVVGGTVGVQIIKVLRQLGNADFLINLTYVLMLGIIGSYMFAESLQSMRKTQKRGLPPPEGKRIVVRAHDEKSALADGISSDPVCGFQRCMPLVLGILVGILAAIMGVGGGFIMVPVMVYLLRMPMHVVVGTSLFQILFTCVNVTIMQAWREPHGGFRPGAAAAHRIVHRRPGRGEARQESCAEISSKYFWPHWCSWSCSRCSTNSWRGPKCCWLM